MGVAVLQSEGRGDIPKEKRAPKHRERMRWHMIGGMCLLNGYRKGAEIGVSTGRFSIFLCSLPVGISMLCVDTWSERPDNTADGQQTYVGWDGEDCYRRLTGIAREYFPERMRLLRMDSLDAAKTVDDGTLDMVFIDADHSYEGCRRDIEAWTPKVRKGGLIAGHDYHANWPGVIRAVDESGPCTVLPDSVWMRTKT